MGKSLAVCVFCSSSDTVPAVYRDTALSLAEEMAARHMTLIYGGGNNGLMGVLSERLHVRGGKVIGVITRNLKEMGYAYGDANEMIVTEDIRQRKAVMEQYADGFICLAGGFGTLEETLEIIALRQLGLLSRPIALMNTNQFFGLLLGQFEKMCSEQFFGPEYTRLFSVTESPAAALDYIVANQDGGEERFLE
ncbi:TIGR00730 family Rossman fold protein [Candidatus Latescibacterota bacterium]